MGVEVHTFLGQQAHAVGPDVLYRADSMDAGGVSAGNPADCRACPQAWLTRSHLDLSATTSGLVVTSPRNPQQKGTMSHAPNQTKPVYEKPTILELGSFSRLTQWSIDPNKWHSWADVMNGTAIADGGIGS